MALRENCFLTVSEEHEADLSFLNHLCSLRLCRSFLAMLECQRSAGSGAINSSGQHIVFIFMWGGLGAAVHSFQ